MSTTARRTRPARAAACLLLAAAASAHAQVDINAWRQSPEFRAMALQRELAADMPQDQSLMLGSHNTFNASAYPQGYALFQHSYTITDQLHLGLRQIDLDIHDIPGSPNNLWVSHAVCIGTGHEPGNMSIGEALLEIRAWMNQNPDEVIFIHTEQHFRTANTPLRGELLQLIELLFGRDSGNDRLIRPSDLGSNFYQMMDELPNKSLNQLRALGRILFTNIGGAGAPCNDNYIEDFPVQDTIYGNGPGTTACSVGSSLRERRYWYYNHAKNFAHDYNSDDINENDFPDTDDIAQGRPFAPDVNNNGVIDYYEQQYWDPQCIGARHSECYSQGNFYAMLYNNTSTGEYQHYGSVDPWVTREAVRAGMDVIRFDPLGTSLAHNGDPLFQPADEHMRATIWSWDYRYLPFANGTPLAAMAVIEHDTARIRWEYPSATLRYAVQDSVGEWAISGESGAFGAAPQEVPGGMNFRVPGNGFEMQNLFGAMVRAGITKVWVNYHDLNGDGAWQQRTQARTFYRWTGTTYEKTPRAATSAFPFVVTNPVGLALAQAIATPATGLAVPAYPGLYPATPSSPIRLNRPMTIVPAVHGVPVSIGR